MMDIVDKLRDLHKQATEERSHFYVASCCMEAIEEITRLRREMVAVGDRLMEAAKDYGCSGQIRGFLRQEIMRRGK